jgi:hypothetical protein
MVLAILEGRKTQTRRVMKPQPVHYPDADVGWWGPDGFVDVHECACPYGYPGDVLYVKEALRRHHGSPFDGGTYCADLTPVIGDDAHKCLGRSVWQWQRDYLPGMFCPRWASRITLEITDISAERLQDISPEDAIAEGVECPYTTPSECEEPSEAIYEYMRIWDYLNAKRGYSWQSNAWVWAITFRRI